MCGLSSLSFTDTYDTLICVGALDVTHVNQTCFESLAAITKPGIYITVKLRTQ